MLIEKTQSTSIEPESMFSQNLKATHTNKVTVKLVTKAEGTPILREAAEPNHAFVATMDDIYSAIEAVLNRLVNAGTVTFGGTSFDAPQMSDSDIQDFAAFVEDDVRDCS